MTGPLPYRFRCWMWHVLQWNKTKQYSTCEWDSGKTPYMSSSHIWGQSIDQSVPDCPDTMLIPYGESCMHDYINTNTCAYIGLGI